MFQARQIDEVQALTEISKCVATPGAITSGSTTVGVAAAVCSVGGASTTSAPATFALGDQLEVYPSAAAACNGVLVSAASTATPGTCTLYFQNITGGTVTPTAGAVYTIIATRLQPGVL
jgi:hypothetical protein